MYYEIISLKIYIKKYLKLKKDGVEFLADISKVICLFKDKKRRKLYGIFE